MQIYLVSKIMHQNLAIILQQFNFEKKFYSIGPWCEASMLAPSWTADHRFYNSPSLHSARSLCGKPADAWGQILFCKWHTRILWRLYVQFYSALLGADYIQSVCRRFRICTVSIFDGRLGHDASNQIFHRTACHIQRTKTFLLSRALLNVNLQMVSSFENFLVNLLCGEPGWYFILCWPNYIISKYKI